jgi:hypothetical protein
VAHHQDQPADFGQGEEDLRGQGEDLDQIPVVGLLGDVLVVGMLLDVGYVHSVLNMQKA